MELPPPDLAATSTLFLTASRRGCASTPCARRISPSVKTGWGSLRRPSVTWIALRPFTNL